MREGILCMSPMALGLLREDAVYGCAGFPPLELAHVAFFFLFFFFSALVLGCFFFFLQPFPHPFAGSIPLLRSSKFVMDLCILKIYS